MTNNVTNFRNACIDIQVEKLTEDEIQKLVEEIFDKVNKYPYSKSILTSTQTFFFCKSTKIIRHFIIFNIPDKSNGIYQR